MSWNRFSFILALTVVLTAPVAWGTVVLRVGLSAMTADSAVIFHGEVVATEVVGGENRPITTIVTLRALEIAKGEHHFKDGQLVISLLGGKRHGMELRVPGMPRFSEGEQVVLFLEKTSTDYALCGLQQGVFRVSKDGQEVSRMLSAMGFAGFDGRGEFAFVDAPSDVVGYPLRALMDEVRFHLSESAGDAR